MFVTLFFDFLALLVLYLICLALSFGLLALLASFGWPFHRDAYPDLADLNRPQALLFGSLLFLLLLIIWLLASYPLLLALLALFLLLGLFLLYRFLSPRK